MTNGWLKKIEGKNYLVTPVFRYVERGHVVSLQNGRMLRVPDKVLQQQFLDEENAPLWLDVPVVQQEELSNIA